MAARYESDNIFAKILQGSIPSTKIFETEEVLAIMDIMPQSKGHCLVIPKAPVRNLLDADPATLQAAIVQVARLAKAAKAAFEADGVVVSQFNEAAGGQTVFHLHFHVVPRYAGEEPKAHAGSGMAEPALLAQQAERIRGHLD